MNDERLVIKVGPAVSAQEIGDETENAVLIRDYRTGNAHLETTEDFENNYIDYDCLPTNVLKWLNSVIEQKMPLSKALGADNNWAVDGYNYDELTDDVMDWMLDAKHQLCFATSMVLGPRVHEGQIEELFSEQLSLF